MVISIAEKIHQARGTENIAKREVTVLNRVARTVGGLPWWLSYKVCLPLQKSWA